MYYNDNQSNEQYKEQLGNTLVFTVDLLYNDEKVDLTDKNISVFLVDPAKNNIPMKFDIVDKSTIKFTFEGKDQKLLGQYHLVVYENKDEDTQRKTDYANIVELVKHSWEKSNGK